MTRYAKRKLKYSLNENFNLLPYVEWDRFVTLTGAQAGQLLLRCLLQWIQIRISAKRGKCTWNSNLQTKYRTERRFHALKFSDGFKSSTTMDWCSVYFITPQALPKYVEWDRIVTVRWSKSGLRVTLSYLRCPILEKKRKFYLHQLFELLREHSKEQLLNNVRKEQEKLMLCIMDCTNPIFNLDVKKEPQTNQWNRGNYQKFDVWSTQL